VFTIDTAQARLEPSGLMPRDGLVDLNKRWDAEFPGRGGHAVYWIALPPYVGSEPMAVLFSRVGNQVHVQLNGVTLRRWGELGEPRYDAAKSALMVTLPAGLLHANRANELRVEVTLQHQRLGGMSVLHYGPESVIEPIYASHRLWRDFAMGIYAVCLAGMGVMSALLWWRQRDALYGWFSVAALLGVVRNVDRIWPDVPAPWPWLGAFVAVCFVAHVALSFRFVMMLLGPVSRGMNRAIDVLIVVDSLLVVLGFGLGWPWLVTVAILAGLLLGAMSLAVVTRVGVGGGDDGGDRNRHLRRRADPGGPRQRLARDAVAAWAVHLRADHGRDHGRSLQQFGGRKSCAQCRSFASRR
jgi:hypothetical protein